MKGRTFTLGATQAAKYDEAVKALMSYISTKFDHRVQRAFEERDAQVGKNLLNEPVAPTKLDPTDATKSKKILDRDGVEWVKYQYVLKKYIDLETKLNDDLQRTFNIILAQCSPAIERALESELEYK